MPRDFVAEPSAADAGLTRGAYRALVLDGLFSQALGVLTSGALLVGCALALGASPAYVGILSAIPFYAQVAQLPAIALIERLRKRKAICVGVTLAARAMLVPLALVPLLANRAVALDLLLLCFAVVTPLGAVGGCAWMSWTCDLVPRARLGEVFSRRQFCANLAAMLAGLAGAGLVDRWGRVFPLERLGGYAGVFALAIAAAMASTWFLTRMPDVAMTAPPPPSLARLFKRPFADRNFRAVMLFLGSWNFAVNLAMPFFTVFLVQDLAMPITVPIALGIVAQVANLLSLPWWGRLSDRRSNKAVIASAGPLMLAATASWVVAAAAGSALVLPLLVAAQIVAGAAGAGLDLASGNLAFKSAPKGEPTVYLGVNGLVRSLAGGTAPLVGGLLAQSLGGSSLALSWGGMSIVHVRPLAAVFLCSAVAGVGALALLRGVAEDGPVSRSGLFRYITGRFPRTIKGETWASSESASRCRVRKTPIS